MSEFNFIQSQRAYEAKFFQFPQVLLYGEQYWATWFCEIA